MGYDRGFVYWARPPDSDLAMAVKGATFEVLSESVTYLRFFEACVPPKTTHHAKTIVRYRKKDGTERYGLGDTKELRDARSFWMQLFLNRRPKKPFEGPVRLLLELTWPWNTGDPKYVRAAGQTPHFTMPDWDNLAKTVTDILVACAYLTNDAQVAEGTVRKFRGQNPGIMVEIEALSTPRRND